MLIAMKKIQQWVLPRQKMINKLLLGLEVAVILIWVVVSAMALELGHQSWLPRLYRLGGRLGIVSLVLFVVVLLPGIIIRLQWWRSVSLPIATIITPFRQRLGVLMFITAFIHASFTTTLPYVSLLGFQALPPPLSPAELFGFFGLIILIPVWMTSNDRALQQLGKWWKTIQRLSYLTIWAVAGHLILIGSNYRWLIILIGILEILSWWKFHQLKQKKLK